MLKNTRSLKNDNNEDNDMPNSTGEDTMKSDTEMNNVTKVGDDITNIVDDVMVNDGEDGTKVSDIESNNCGE